MLVFAGVSTDDSSLRATLNRSLQRKIMKRPSRGAKNANPQDKLQTPTNASTQKPTALELLSRSAPVAPSKSSRQRNTAIDDNSPTTPSKRPSNYPDRFHTDGECVVKPAFAKRKYTRRNRHKTSFMERIQEAAALVKELPNVEDTVTNAYDTKNTDGVGDAELTILSRSLLHAAVAVQLANEEKKASAAPLRQLPVGQQVQRVFEAERQRISDLTDGREALSPIAAGLFCEEEYSEADDNNYLDVATSAINENDTASRSTTVEQSNMRSQQNGRNASLSVMQERAVLQELSVWLRNMTADVSSR
ncbi:unnamed protein product [Peronospora farinosa]|uniref:BHLH domain-containing protein n=1 Tax=Peronospora farinosa TaxID=134698 RepID=A0ABN8C1Q7_9STRA|nr:unnamed protein product [Peronospora farinosa]